METLKINTFDENIYFSARHFGRPFKGIRFFLESIEIYLTTSEIISLDNIPGVAKQLANFGSI